jgi:hypothetical protein
MDKKKFKELLDQLRLAVPQEVRAAQEMVTRKDQIVNQALADARHTKVQAEDEFRARLQQTEVLQHAQKRAAETLKDAEERAARLLQQAEAEAQARRTDADAYALRSLRALERELNTVSNSVQKGIDLLAGNTALAGNSARSRE